MADISGFLNRICNMIEEDDLPGASDLITQYVSSDPSIVDDRFKAELSLIEKMMDYKTNLNDWAYFRRMRLTYQYIEMQYASKLPEIDETSIGNDPLPDNDTIWCCWLQGLENAPDVVKKCVDSLKKFDRNIVVLSEDNYSDYITLPDYITEKKNKGIIDRTHFSDLIRIELLSSRGGTWIDSTVFCSDASFIREVLDTYPLFCYSFAMRDTISPYMLFDNWFLHCTQRSRIIDDTKKIIYSFWKNENYMMHYFLFHLIFAISCRRHPEEMMQIPQFSLEPCHILQHEMKNQYDPMRWDHIMKMSGIHKMTYKFEPFEIKGTMMEHLLNL